MYYSKIFIEEGNALLKWLKYVFILAIVALQQTKKKALIFFKGAIKKAIMQKYGGLVSEKPTNLRQKG